MNNTKAITKALLIFSQPRSFSMRQASIILLFLSIIGLSGCHSTVKQADTLYPESDSRSESVSDSNEIKMTFLLDIASILMGDQTISPAVKSELSRQVITPLRKASTIELSGKDENTRPLAVNFQKAFEQGLLDMLAEKKLKQVVAVIHTPLPATPLCNPSGKHLTETLHPDVQQDPDRIKTVEDRTITVRRMAKHGNGLNLYIAYPKNGLSQRSEAQQKVYHEELANKANTSLKDSPLFCDSLPEHMIGASYLLITPNNQQLFL